MKIQPLADRVLVLPAPAEEKVGGIIIPDTAKEKPQHGKVIAVGEGTKDDKMVLKEATRCFTVNMQAQSSRKRVRSILSCVRATFWLY